MLTGLEGIVMFAVPYVGAFRLFNEKEKRCYFFSCSGSARRVKRKYREQKKKPGYGLTQYHKQNPLQVIIRHLPA
jgi:hypothetical protein